MQLVAHQNIPFICNLSVHSGEKLWHPNLKAAFLSLGRYFITLIKYKTPC